jgi:hypothetical protein
MLKPALNHKLRLREDFSLQLDCKGRLDPKEIKFFFSYAHKRSCQRFRPPKSTTYGDGSTDQFKIERRSFLNRSLTRTENEWPTRLRDQTLAELLILVKESIGITLPRMAENTVAELSIRMYVFSHKLLPNETPSMTLN